MAQPIITTMFLFPFTLYLLFLQFRVAAIRVKTATYLGDRLFKNRKDGRDPMDPVHPDPLYLAIRCQLNSLENIPLALLLAFATESAGADPSTMSYILGSFFVLRVAHVELGLRGKGSMGVPRLVSFGGTQLTLAGLAGWGAWLVKDKARVRLGI